MQGGRIEGGGDADALDPSRNRGAHAGERILKRHGAIGGCSNVGGDIADAAVLGAAVDHPYDAYPAPIGYPPPPPEGYPPLPPGYLAYPSFPGEAPCFTNIGQPYFTPPGAPCF